ncbi:putative ABC transporter [Trypanosoma cruzi]|uniref:Putative ABC transporter n=1 Tax=Trypanosoma cruzi TaxID=5693 RepID=A0A2V2VUT7_TRYCR|nr:putative ABC transporter [Trypanosoma cruzi]
MQAAGYRAPWPRDIISFSTIFALGFRKHHHPCPGGAAGGTLPAQHWLESDDTAGCYGVPDKKATINDGYGASNEPLTDKATEHGISIQIEGMGSNQESCFGTAVGCEMNRDNSSISLLNETRNLHDESEYYKPHRQSFARHFAVLFMKRVHCAKRDLRLVVFQILLPVVFLSLALLTDLMSPPKQPALTLDASLYPGYDTQPYSEVMWTVSSKFPDVFDVGEVVCLLLLDRITRLSGPNAMWKIAVSHSLLS